LSSLLHNREGHELLGREIAQRTMRTILVVLYLSILQEELGLGDAVEELSVYHLIS